MDKTPKHAAADSAPVGDYLTAAQAMALLNVSAQTLYAYVSRKGIRTKPVAGSRQRLYWKADIEQLRRRKSAARQHGHIHDSAITLVTPDALYYRGQDVAELAERASFETVAALLWASDEQHTFGDRAPKALALWPALRKLLAGQGQVNLATALFPLLEEANPKAYDLSRPGMARTGAAILRWLAAITVGAEGPTDEPVHLFLARELRLKDPAADIVRRILVLSADHGHEPSAQAVRALAATGVTPWRALIGGLSVTIGRNSKSNEFDAIYRFVTEITGNPDPRSVIVQRIRIGDPLPGFDAGTFPAGDPRAVALLRHCAKVFARERSWLRLQTALQAVAEIRDQQPTFALACIYAGVQVGLGPQASLFHLGRAAGWIAHAIEQYHAGDGR